MSSSACDPGWTYHETTNKCYKYDQTKRRWPDALKSCISSNHSSTLASVPDSATNDFLADLSGGSGYWTWLGGYLDDQGDWQWTDGSTWAYTKWSPNEPNNAGGSEKYLGLNLESSRTWNDFNDGGFYGSICQYTPGNFVN